MASPSDNPLKRLIGEIHRRSLWQVLGIYVVASWAVLQVVDTLGGALRLPDWIEPMALVLLIIGLPIVLATAFVQEGGPGRQAKDVATPTADAANGAPGLFTWRKTFTGGVLAFALLGFIGTGWILFGGGMGTGSVPTSIEQSVAVLPFDNMSGDPDNEYFSDGITEELLNALAHIPDLRVPGRTSSFAFKGQNITIQQIADTLDVAHVLEGSVRRDGERVLIAAQLVDARADTRIWSETFERELTDIFAIQREIATAIADQLQVTLSGDQQRRLVPEATESTEAHEAYLRGRYFWNQRTPAALQTAFTQFRRAIDVDPNYAEAYSGLADSYNVADGYARTAEQRNYRTNVEQGLIAARRAVSLAPDLGMAHASLGFALFLSGAWDISERELNLAIELSPGYATAHQWYAMFLWSTGGVIEGLAHTEQAVLLDPVSPIISFNKATGLQLAGRTDEAIEQLRETTQLAPGLSRGWVLLASTLLEIGEYEEGLAAWINFVRSSNADVPATSDVYQAVIRHRETGERQTFPDFNGNDRNPSLGVRPKWPIGTGPGTEMPSTSPAATAPSAIAP